MGFFRMNTKLLRLAYAFEFLVAQVAIFTVWSEIGGQSALDLMHWAWKLGFGLLLGSAIVAYTQALVTHDSLWTVSSLRWLLSIVLLILAIGVVTYFYAVQVDAGQSDETGTVSRLHLRAPGLHMHEEASSFAALQRGCLTQATPEL
jgi:hypothetical protein